MASLSPSLSLPPPPPLSTYSLTDRGLVNYSLSGENCYCWSFLSEEIGQIIQTQEIQGIVQAHRYIRQHHAKQSPNALIKSLFDSLSSCSSLPSALAYARLVMAAAVGKGEEEEEEEENATHNYPELQRLSPRQLSRLFAANEYFSSLDPLPLLMRLFHTALAAFFMETEQAKSTAAALIRVLLNILAILFLVNQRDKSREFSLLTSDLCAAPLTAIVQKMATGKLDKETFMRMAEWKREATDGEYSYTANPDDLPLPLSAVSCGPDALPRLKAIIVNRWLATAALRGSRALRMGPPSSAAPGPSAPAPATSPFSAPEDSHLSSSLDSVSANSNDDSGLANTLGLTFAPDSCAATPVWCGKCLVVHCKQSKFCWWSCPFYEPGDELSLASSTAGSGPSLPSYFSASLAQRLATPRATADEAQRFAAAISQRYGPVEFDPLAVARGEFPFNILAPGIPPSVVTALGVFAKRLNAKEAAQTRDTALGFIPDDIIQLFHLSPDCLASLSAAASRSGDAQGQGQGQGQGQAAGSSLSGDEEYLSRLADLHDTVNAAASALVALSSTANNTPIFPSDFSSSPPPSLSSVRRHRQLLLKNVSLTLLILHETFHTAHGWLPQLSYHALLHSYNIPIILCRSLFSLSPSPCPHDSPLRFPLQDDPSSVMESRIYQGGDGEAGDEGDAETEEMGESSVEMNAVLFTGYSSLLALLHKLTKSSAPHSRLLYKLGTHKLFVRLSALYEEFKQGLEGLEYCRPTQSAAGDNGIMDPPSAAVEPLTVSDLVEGSDEDDASEAANAPAVPFVCPAQSSHSPSRFFTATMAPLQPAPSDPRPPAHGPPGPSTPAADARSPCFASLSPYHGLFYSFHFYACRLIKSLSAHFSPAEAAAFHGQHPHLVSELFHLIPNGLGPIVDADAEEQYESMKNYIRKCDELDAKEFEPADDDPLANMGPRLLDVFEMDTLKFPRLHSSTLSTRLASYLFINSTSARQYRFIHAVELKRAQRSLMRSMIDAIKGGGEQQGQGWPSGWPDVEGARGGAGAGEEEKEEGDEEDELELEYYKLLDQMN